MGKKSVLAAVLFVTLELALYANAYTWSSSLQITNSLDDSGNTILTIQFDFTQMSNPPTSGHFPTEFRVCTLTGGSSCVSWESET